MIEKTREKRKKELYDFLFSNGAMGNNIKNIKLIILHQIKIQFYL